MICPHCKGSGQRFRYKFMILKILNCDDSFCLVVKDLKTDKYFNPDDYERLLKTMGVTMEDEL